MICPYVVGADRKARGGGGVEGGRGLGGSRGSLALSFFSMGLIHKLILHSRYRPTKHSLLLSKLTNISSEGKVG